MTITKANTITNAEAQKTAYFLSEGFKSMEDPMYEKLSGLLEAVKQASIPSSRCSGMCMQPEHGWVVENPMKALMDVVEVHDFPIGNLNVQYYKKGDIRLLLNMPDICNICLKADDGWDTAFLEELARAAAKCAVGICARSVNQVLVHNGVFYTTDDRGEYPWSGKGRSEKMTVSEFIPDKGRFKIMGIYKIPKNGVEYETDADGFSFEDRFSSQLYFAVHNTMTAGMVEDDVQISAYVTTTCFGKI